MIWVIPGNHPKQSQDPLEPLAETPDRPGASGRPKGPPRHPEDPLETLKFDHLVQQSAVADLRAALLDTMFRLKLAMAVPAVIVQMGKVL